MGRYLIYDGPLNVYRNFFEADFVIRQYEVNRVHTQLNSVWSESYFTGQSNYSLTLGFARDLNYWDPQVRFAQTPPRHMLRQVTIVLHAKLTSAKPITTGLDHQR